MTDVCQIRSVSDKLKKDEISLNNTWLTNETTSYANYQFKPERYSDIDRMIREPLTTNQVQYFVLFLWTQQFLCVGVKNSEKAKVTTT